MGRTVSTRRLAAIVFALTVCSCLPASRAVADGPVAPSWTQWGGPTRDFRAPAGRLAAEWPEGGPQTLWRRSIGEGHSAVLYEDGRLYTMHRQGEDEIVLCLDAATGQTNWETPYTAVYDGLRQYGSGPRSTPLLVGDRLFTVGVTGRMLALGKHDGEILWSAELWGEELGGNHLGHGYASSPLAFQDTVIVPVGGEGASIVAFDQSSGTIRWRAHSLRNSYSSPKLLTLAGRLQLVVFMAEELISLDPETGELLWSWSHANQWGHNITMPSVDEDVLFFSSPQAGARGLRIVATPDGFETQQVWSSRRIQFYHAATVQDGRWVYGSTGLTSPAFMTAVDIRTGETAWKKRGFGKANCIEADGRLIILDENGVLYLARATPDDLVVDAQAQLLDRYAWSVPTIVDQTMYVRNQGEILAVDLGPIAPPQNT